MVFSLIPPAPAVTSQRGTSNLWPQPKCLFDPVEHVGRQSTSTQWRVWNGGTPTLTCVRSTSVYHSPPSCIGAPATGAGPIIVDAAAPLIALTAGVTYVISSWIKQDLSHGQVGVLRVGVGLYALLGITIISQHVSDPTNTGWQRIWSVVTVATTKNYEIYFAQSVGTPTAGVTLSVDDVQIEVGAAPTDACNGAMGPSYRWLATANTVSLFAPAISTAASGGTIAAGTYLALQTVVTAAGETLPCSAFAQVTTTGSASTITATPILVPTPAATCGFSGGGVTSVTLTQGSYGFATAPTITTTGGTPTRLATFAATIANGVLTRIDVLDPGAYATAPTIVIPSPVLGYNLYTQKQGDSGWTVTNTAGSAVTLTSYAPGAAALPTADSSGLTGMPWNTVSARAGSTSPGGAAAVSSTVTDLTVLGNLTVLGAATGKNAAATTGIHRPYVNVKSYGAVGDGQNDDTGAILAAKMVADGTSAALYFPAGTYPCSVQLRFNTYVFGDAPGVSLIKYTGSGVGNLLSYLLPGGTGIDRPATGNSFAGAASSFIVLPGTRWQCGMRDIGIVGPATAASWAVGRAQVASGICVQASALLQNVQVSGFDAGVVLAASGGHWVLSSMNIFGNWYGIYSIKDFGDGILENSEIQNTFANYASHSADFNAATIRRTHLTNGLYGFYQEFNSTNQPCTTAAQLSALVHGSGVWLTGSRWYECHLEGPACTGIYSEIAAVDLYGPSPYLCGVDPTGWAPAYTKAPGPTTSGQISDVDWRQIGHAWGASIGMNSYGRPVDYAMVVGAIRNLRMDSMFGIQPLGAIWAGCLLGESSMELREGLPTFGLTSNTATTVGSTAGGGSMRMKTIDTSGNHGTGQFSGVPATQTITLAYPPEATLATPGTPAVVTGTGSPWGTPGSWAATTQTIRPRVTATSNGGLTRGFSFIVSAIACTTAAITTTGTDHLHVSAAAGSASFHVTLQYDPSDPGLSGGALASPLTFQWSIED